MEVIERGLSPIQPQCTRLRRSHCVGWTRRFIELGGMVVAQEAGSWRTAMGHAQVFDAGVDSGRMNRQGRESDSARLVLLSIPSGVVRDS